MLTCNETRYDLQQGMNLLNGIRSRQKPLPISIAIILSLHKYVYMCSTWLLAYLLKLKQSAS